MSDQINESPAGIGGELQGHYESLCRQAQELRQDFPDFDLSAALEDADFVRLTAPKTGVSLRRAFYAMNREKLDELAQLRGAESVREALSKSLSTAARQPREGGGRQSAAELRSDYRAMDAKGREQLKKQIRDAAALGKKIYP